MSSRKRNKRSDSVVNPSVASKRRKCEDIEEIDQQTKCGKIGIIESVSLCNFMCHDNLEFKFGPNINFIIGQNGSGKSAILTAIILALGGRSSATGRYPNIKGFIKTGKQKAKIEVVLKNGGNHPFKPDSYGPKITVVREISTDGVSSYKLKSSTGKIISTHKEDLSNILNAMDIQIENPVSALTQESSRSFLTARKPDKLYQFFYQGTGLETLEKSYHKIRLMKEEAAAELQKKKEMLPVMEKELRTWKKIIDTSAKTMNYRHELFWALVTDMEKRLMQWEEEFKKDQKELATLKREYDICKDKLSGTTSNLNELQKKREECDAVMERYRQKISELQAVRANYAAELRNVEGKLSSSKRKEQSALEEILSLQNSITENLMKDQNDLNEEKRLRENEVGTLKCQLVEKNQDLKQLQEEWDAKMNLQVDLNAKRDSIISEINRHKYGLKKQEEALIRLKSASINKVNVFGGQTQNVLNEIQRQSRLFSKLPKGPIGAYLEVRDPRWITAVEMCISANLLRAYCCDNYKDSIVLKEILKQYYPEQLPTVLTSKYASDVHDISKFKVLSDFPTVFDMLTIHDPVIANFLIDNIFIESKILIEDTNTAVSVMMNPPTNCKLAILMNCSTIAINPYRFYSSEKRSQKSLLSSVGKGDINTQKQSIVKTKTEINCLQSELDSLPNHINQIGSEMKILEKQVVEHKLMIKRISQRIEELQVTEDPKTRHDMQEDLQQLQMESEKIKVEKQKYELKVNESKSKIDDIQKEIDTNTGLLYHERKKYDNFCLNLSSCGQDKETLASGVNKYAIKIKESEKKLEPLKKKVEEGHRDIKAAMDNAEKMGPRIETDRSSEVLRRLLDETEKVVEKQSQCNSEDLKEKYNEKYEKIKDAKEKLSEKERYVEHIDKMYKLRQNYFRTICSQTQYLISFGFMACLKEDYNARALFDTKARTLTLEVHPKKSGVKLKNRGGKCSNLSGGERSYATIGFLLAMWDRIKSPFKILDEYDVFMDSNNRKLSIDLLILQAGMMSDTQFIFLSPLDLPQIEESPLIKIHQMPAPERVEPCL